MWGTLLHLYLQYVWLELFEGGMAAACKIQMLCLVSTISCKKQRLESALLHYRCPTLAMRLEMGLGVTEHRVKKLATQSSLDFWYLIKNTEDRN